MTKNLFSEAADAIEHHTYRSSREALVRRLRDEASAGSELQGLLDPVRVAAALELAAVVLRTEGYAFRAASVTMAAAVTLAHQAGMSREGFLKGMEGLWDKTERHAENEAKARRGAS